MVQSNEDYIKNRIVISADIYSLANTRIISDVICVDLVP